jgi:Flp pilus assembly protein TadD
MGQSSLGRAYYDSVAVVAQHRLRTLSDYGSLHLALGTAEAYRGNADGAIREARRAEELEPLSRNHFIGMHVMEEAAHIYMAAGQPDSAVSRLRTALAEPSLLSAARLRIDPLWLPLRSNAGFQRLVGGK